jgi:hypothetical protein
MKKLLLVGSLFFTFTTAFAQSSPASLQWERSQNGVASTNNYFVKTKNDISGNNYVLSSSDEDMLVVMFNSSTQIVESYRYNNATNSNDYPKDFDVDANGNVYIAGYSYMGFKYTMTVVKFDAAGNLLWELNYLPSNTWIYPTEVSANAMCLDNSGNVYFTGSINDSLVAVKLSSSGAVQWATKIANAGNYLGSGNDIAIDAFGSVFIAGKCKNSGGTFDAVAVKLNAAGVQQWTRSINGGANADDQSLFIGLDNSSNVYVSSEVADTSASMLSGYLTKYNASGAQQWQKVQNAGSNTSVTPVELIVDNVGNNYLGVHFLTNSSTGYTMLYKHSAGGSPVYGTAIDFPAENDNELNDIYVDANTNLYAAGRLPYTGKLFFAKLNASGSATISADFDHNGNFDFYAKAGIVAEPSGFFNVISTSVRIYNARFSNTGTFLYEGVYSGSSNTSDQAVKVIAQGSSAVYGLGYVTNDNSGADAVISKYDNEGNILWQNIIDNNLGNDEAFDMARDSVYNIYLAKRINGGSELIKFDSIGSPVWTYSGSQVYHKVMVANGGNSYLASNESGTVTAADHFVVAKLDPSGSLVYQSPSISYQMGYNLQLGSMNVDNNERIIAGGYYTYDQNGPNQKVVALLEKYSTSGNLLWQKHISLPDSTSANAMSNTNIKKILVDSTNDIYVCGNTWGNSGFGQYTTFVDKYNGNGTLQWHQLYNMGGSHEIAADMKFLSNGQLVVLTGTLGSVVIKKLNPNNGNIVWETPVYIGPSTEGASLQVDSNDDIFFSGQGLVGSGPSLRDIVLGKISSSGNLYWTLTKAGSAVENDFAAHIDVTNTGRIYMAASMANSSGSGKDFSVLKFCDIPQHTLTVSGATQNICAGSTVTMSATGGSTYLWSDLTTSNDTLIASATGDYFCTSYKPDGCFKNSDTIHVELKTPPSTPQICLVTVDSLSTHNIIAWDKASITGATAFNIYREDVTNIYSYIGTVLYDSLSEFHDYGADPNVTTKRYKITAIDSCGQESPMSNYHNTIYIVSNGSGQFSWNPIYTIENSPNPVTQYLLMREDVAGSGVWNQVAATAGTQFIVNDPNYASFPTGRWRVETDWSISCTPVRGAINTSRSNIKSPSSVGLDEANAAAEFSMSPNPATNQLTVKTGMRGKTTVSIYNALGQKVLCSALESGETTINIEHLEAGTYFVEVTGEQRKTTKKLIKY